MSLFSEQLQRYMDEKQISVYMLSKASGIERSFVHRIVNGKRFPSQSELVDRLALGLMLSPAQSEALAQCYHISKIGEDVYTLREAVRAFFSTMTPPALSLPFAGPAEDFPLPATVEGTASVHQLLRHVLDLEAASPQGEIHILAQPGNAALMSLVQGVTMSNPALRVRQIFCFDNMPTSGRANLRQLSGLMPALLSCGDYRAYYYHDFLSTVDSPILPLTQLVITSRYALQLSAEHTCAICTPTGPVYELMLRVFERALQRCLPLVVDMSTPQRYMDYHIRLDAQTDCGNGENIYILCGEPCLSPFFTRQLYERNLAPVSDGARAQMIDALVRHSENGLRQMQACHTAIYCTRSGVRAFLASGRLQEIPPVFYTPFSKRSRLELMEAFLNAAEQAQFDLRVYDAAALSIPEGFALSVSTSNTLSMVYAQGEGRHILLDLREPTIAAAVSEYLEALPPMPGAHPAAPPLLRGREAVDALRGELRGAGL